MPLTKRAMNEIAHGKELASKETEAVWGWGTPAGLIRAERRSKFIVDGAGLGAGQRALEIGCGTGNFTEMFAKTGANIIAVDISPDLLEKARSRNLPSDQVQFIEQRFEDSESTGPFDSVIGSSVLHHLDIQPALTKIFQLLKPGGRLSFAEPNALNPQVFLERKFYFIKPIFGYVSPDETAFNRWALKKMMLDIGFVDIVITPLDWLHPLVPVPMIGLVRKFESWFEKTAFVREFAGSIYIHARRPLNDN